MWIESLKLLTESAMVREEEGRRNHEIIFDMFIQVYLLLIIKTWKFVCERIFSFIYIIVISAVLMMEAIYFNVFILFCTPESIIHSMCVLVQQHKLLTFHVMARCVSILYFQQSSSPMLCYSHLPSSKKVCLNLS